MSAIDITSSYTIDHFKLGLLFADWNNVEQAEFLQGAAMGFNHLGAWGHMQLSLIVDATKVDGDDGMLPDVRQFIERLHEYFKDDDA